jgi:hypothetical protein
LPHGLCSVVDALTFRHKAMDAVADEAHALAAKVLFEHGVELFSDDVNNLDRLADLVGAAVDRLVDELVNPSMSAKTDAMPMRTEFAGASSLNWTVDSGNAGRLKRNVGSAESRATDKSSHPSTSPQNNCRCQ